MNLDLAEQAIVEAVYAEVKEHFTQVHDLAHGWDHIERVYKLARYIGEREVRREPCDLFVVEMAVLMHDLGRAAPHDVGGHHADLSVSMARDVMQHHTLAEERQQAIEHAIIAHSFSRKVEPQTLEAKIVRDADRLDGLGAIGVMRWAVTGAVRHGREGETVAYHPTDPFGQRHELDDKRYMLDHFYKKLLQLMETMQTETGRALAWRRTQFMEQYLDEFRKELELF
ncbi:HD domain-containing protein [Ktedonobacter robiniae]|uniref:Phosphohydrolase n=1 Tax=Ktedonobacter robiniae TaxID=2778365 RepID=A0ABQ3UM00_9CHLR|nr:HD domain-containing protein [Ktedonobacter robiniae]GHO53713.1 phosphohydrolase [Ktedonobacter robiniae]